jgi:hypothetical protein
LPFDPTTGTTLAHHGEPAGLAGARIVPGHDAVVLSSLAVAAARERQALGEAEEG